MSADIRIIIEDEGSTVPLGDTAPISSPPVATPGPADRVPGAARWRGTPSDSSSSKGSAGPKDPGGQSSTPGPADRSTEDFGKAAALAATAIGAGGLAKQAFTLTDAFTKLYAAVTRSADQMAGAEPGQMPLRIDELGKNAGRALGGDGDALEPLPSVADQLMAPGGGTNDIKAAMAKAMEGVFGAGAGAAFEGGAGLELTGTAAAGSEAAAGVSSLAAAAGPAALAVTALAAATVGGAIVIKKTIDTLRGEADRLSGMSGPLASATAESGIRSELADLQRANRIGPDLANLERLGGRLDEANNRLLTEIYRVLLKIFDQAAPLAELLIKFINGTAEAVPDIAAQIAKWEGVILLLTQQLPALGPLAAGAGQMIQALRALVAIAKRFEDDKPEPPLVDPFMDAFLAQFADARKARPGVEERAAAFRRAREGQGMPLPEGAQ